MKEIKDIIAQNLIDLRKSHNLTQNDFAAKLNYSDNTVSRWEHGEITPSIETLEQIAKIYDVPIESLLKENAVVSEKKVNKREFLNQLVTAILFVCTVWFIAAICYFYVETFQSKNVWIIFVWAVPISCALMTMFALKSQRKILTFVFASLLIWTFLAALYLHFLKYNLYLLFIVGIPVQTALSILMFVRKRK